MGPDARMRENPLTGGLGVARRDTWGGEREDAQSIAHAWAVVNHDVKRAAGPGQAGLGIPPAREIAAITRSVTITVRWRFASRPLPGRSAAAMRSGASLVHTDDGAAPLGEDRVPPDAVE